MAVPLAGVCHVFDDGAQMAAVEYNGCIFGAGCVIWSGRTGNWVVGGEAPFVMRG